MKKIIVLLVVFSILLVTGNSLQAQTKNGLISIEELLKNMPEFKRADTTLGLYRATLEQQFEAYKKEFEDQQKMLASPDTLKYSQVQLNVKRQTLQDIGYKLQNYNEEASRLLEQRRLEILTPIQKKAQDAIEAVAKENGYAYVFEKETLHVYPAADDILPLVKKKLGIRN
jgi:outer membrane protein